MSDLNNCSQCCCIDFSEIEFSTIEVETAGNDCLDVSGGIYLLGDAQFVGCADKAISVGERSNLVFRRARILSLIHISEPTRPY